MLVLDLELDGVRVLAAEDLFVLGVVVPVGLFVAGELPVGLLTDGVLFVV